MALSDVKIIKVTTALASPLAAKVDKSTFEAFVAAEGAANVSLSDSIASEQSERIAALSAANGRIDALDANKAGKAAFDAFVTAVDAANETLSDSITDEIARASGAENTLSEAIVSEQGAREALAVAHDVRLDAIESVLPEKATVAALLSEQEAREEVAAGLVEEKARALAAEEALQDSNLAEADARIAGLAAANGRIDALDANKAEKSAFDAFVTAEGATNQSLSDSISAEITRAQGAELGLQSGIDTEVAQRTLDVAELDNRVAPIEALVPRYSDRAGDARSLFSSALTGDPLARPIIAAGTVQASSAGTVLRIIGGDTDDTLGYVDIAPRIAQPLYPERCYQVTYRLRRNVDPTDPSNNAVELRWQNLNQNKAAVSNVRLGDALEPTVADGVLTYSFLIGKAGAPGDLVYTIPPSAIYGLPLIRVYGNGQETDIIAISGPLDVTDRISGGADVTALTDRVGLIEGALPDKTDLSLFNEFVAAEAATNFSLSQSIGDEISRATDAEQVLQGNLNGEAAERQLGDGVAESRAADIDTLRAVATRDLIGRQSATAEGGAIDVDVLRTVATRDLIGRQSATAEGRAGDTDALRAIATRDLIRRQSATAEGRASDSDALRAIAMRSLIGKQAGTAESRAGDIDRLRQPVVRAPATSARISAVDIAFQVSDRNVVITPGRSSLASAGRALYFGGTLAIPAPATGHIDGEAVTINSYNASVNFVYAGTGRMARAGVSNVVVRDAATSAVLVSGTDYRINLADGALMKVASGDANRAVTASYDWSDVRYDLVEVDASGAISLKAGTSRSRDAAEYLPQRTAGRTPVLVVRSDSAGVTAWRWRDPEEALVSAPAIIQRKRARNMGNFHRALRSGDPISIAGYGDSRTCIGGTTVYTPNGPTRDIATTSFMEAQGADFKATIPLYDFGDGAGQVHTKVGWNWDLLRAIERLYPNAVSYLNFGFGGTTAGSTNNGGTVPARLAELTGSGAQIATIAFGMNELGTGTTTADLVVIGEACRAAAIDPVFIAPARPNAERSSGSLESWIIENREVQAAADYLQAPFVDTVALYGADSLTGMLAPREMCSSNHYNHDSLYELALIGRALSAIVLDL